MNENNLKLAIGIGVAMVVALYVVPIALEAGDILYEAEKNIKARIRASTEEIERKRQNHVFDKD